MFKRCCRILGGSLTIMAEVAKPHSAEIKLEFGRGGGGTRLGQPVYFDNF